MRNHRQHLRTTRIAQGGRVTTTKLYGSARSGGKSKMKIDQFIVEMEILNPSWTFEKINKRTVFGRFNKAYDPQIKVTCSSDTKPKRLTKKRG